MKHFIIEGKIINADLINDDIMKVHMAYSQKAMDTELILMAGLKSDMSGGIFMMKAEDIKIVEAYLENEPLRINGIQEYKITEFSMHYVNECSNEWNK